MQQEWHRSWRRRAATGVDYTNFATALDEIVTPYTSAFLSNDGNNRNVLIQSPCFLLRALTRHAVSLPFTDNASG
jgi:hypothetical protein